MRELPVALLAKGSAVATPLSFQEPLQSIIIWKVGISCYKSVGRPDRDIRFLTESPPTVGGLKLSQKEYAVYFLNVRIPTHWVNFLLPFRRLLQLRQNSGQCFVNNNFLTRDNRFQICYRLPLLHLPLRHTHSGPYELCHRLHVRDFGDYGGGESFECGRVYSSGAHVGFCLHLSDTRRQGFDHYIDNFLRRKVIFFKVTAKTSFD